MSWKPSSTFPLRESMNAASTLPSGNGNDTGPNHPVYLEPVSPARPTAKLMVRSVMRRLGANVAPALVELA